MPELADWWQCILGQNNISNTELWKHIVFHLTTLTHVQLKRSASEMRYVKTLPLSTIKRISYLIGDKTVKSQLTGLDYKLVH